MRFCRPLIASALITVGGLALAYGQPASGVIRGQVTDPSGRTVPDAAVTLSTGRRAAVSVKSDAQGQYRIGGINPGIYSIRVNAKGFAVMERQGYEVSAGTVQTLDFPLTLAANSETLTVAEGVKVDVDPSTNAGALILRGKDLDALSDDRDDLAADLQALAGPAAGPNGGQIYIDGFTGGKLPRKSNIREVRVNQNPFSAQYDKLGLGRVEIFTKPGSEDFHGELVFQYGNSAFNARNPFVAVKPPYERRQWEGEVGGPLGKKTSFFADFEIRHVTENAFINAQTLDANLKPVAVSQGVIIPRSSTEENVKIDRQLRPNHTLTMSYRHGRDNQDNQGVGGFSLATRAYGNRDGEDTVQIAETGVLSANAVTETRARFWRQRSRQNGSAGLFTTQVLDAFTGGGPPLTVSFNNQDRWEVQNLTTVTHGAHVVRWGGRVRGIALTDQDTQNYVGSYTFNTLEAYRLTLAGLQAGQSPAQIRQAGGGASQFTLAAGNPLALLNQFDFSFFALDDFRVRPNLMLSAGVRYEWQTNLGDRHDVAPRLGLAWGFAPKTVLRLGAGIFYDRVGEGLTLDSLRRDGVRQQQFVVSSPDFFPLIPSPAQLAASRQGQSVRRIDSSMQAPELGQLGVGVERQLPKNMVIALNYLHTRGWHNLRSRNINAPLPGTGRVPYEGSPAIYFYEASGTFRQNQLIASLNARVSAKFSITGSYAWGRALSDTDGSGTFPADPYDLRSEYGRAGFDIRHRVQMNGSIAAPWGLKLSPFLVATSGRPYNITVGRDLNGDTIFTDRPGASRANIGGFDLSQQPEQAILPRNYGEGPGQFALNLRLGKTFTLGESKESRKRNGKDSGRDPMELTFSASGRNILNHPNLASPVGNLSSPYFGHSLALAAGPGGGGSVAGVRRIDLQIKLSF